MKMDFRILNLSFLFLFLTFVSNINSDEGLGSGAKRSLHKDAVASGAKQLFGLKNKKLGVHFISEAGKKYEIKKVIKRDSASEGISESKPADHGVTDTSVDSQGSSSKDLLEGEKNEKSEESENHKEGSETLEKDEKGEKENGKTDEGESGKTNEEKNEKPEKGENEKPEKGENEETGEGKSEENANEKSDEEKHEEENTHDKGANEEPEKEEVENTEESVKGISPVEPETVEPTSSIEASSNAVPVNEGHSTTTSGTISGKSVEPAPLNTFYVRKDDEICLLVKFQAYISSEDEAGTYYLPESADASGRCGKKISFITISWDEYTFTMNFSREHNGKQCFWTLKGLNLQRVAGASYYYIRDETKGDPFKIECKMSYYCPESDIHLYKKDDDEDTDDEVIVRLKHMQLQPFGVENGQFSEDVHKCREDVMGTIGIPREHSVASVQDETVPLAVGLTLAILTLIAVLGFSIHRAYVMRKVDYNSME